VKWISTSGRKFCTAEKGEILKESAKHFCKIFLDRKHSIM